MTDGEIEKLRADVERLSAHVSDLQRAVLWLAHGRVYHADGWRSSDGVVWYRVPKNESPCDGCDPECP